MPRENFLTVSIKKDIIKKVDDYLASLPEQATVDSRAALIATAIEDYINRQKPRFEHVNTFVDHAKIADYELKRIVSVYFKTEDEVRKFIECSTSSRDRALWMLLFEGGLRINEGLGMTVGSLSFDKYGCYAIVDGKTGQRRVRFVQATPFLREYLNLHPGRDDPKCPLWVAEGTKRRLHSSSVRRSLQRVLKRTGLKKRVWPHLFRHSRGTINAKFMTEAELNVFMGWRQGSRQSQTYVHLNGADLDEKILEHLGLTAKMDKSSKEEELKPIPCPRCGVANPSTGKLCFKCGSYLTLEEALKVDEQKGAEMDDLRKRMIGMEHAQEENTRKMTDLFRILSKK